ncbi:hypothetical protein [Streptomyces hesseae]|uniref:Extensin n=1 Tax=Streptomyces hesseae TaxID=3075519 RepID=A0ABU2SNP9_9ACTN|nr:hypothetical protein [Streptomyces sp. DSM 40473]MDT0450612.1 hypothetical protein [Streptomyces sp. DSM 40473]
MADDHRYDHDWLDDDAVERLLRGEFSAPREDAPGAPGAPGAGTAAGFPAGSEAAAVAKQLDAAFRSLTDIPSAGAAPLPGEEAALAAFREARAASAAPAVTAAPVAARGAALWPVEALRSFLRRPARTALALALAGCAVGGVAVAAGTGVLPGPFGRSGKEPSPSASVTLADETDVATVAPGAPTPGATPAPGASAHPSGRPDPSRTPGGKESGPASGSSASPVHGDGDDARDGKGDKGNKGDKPGKNDDPGALDGAKAGRAWAAKVCREFLANSKGDGSGNANGKGLDEDEARTLERFAGGSSAVRAYCERVLAADGKGDEDGDGSVWDDLVNRAPRSRSVPRAAAPAPAATPGVTLFGASAL